MRLARFVLVCVLGLGVSSQGFANVAALEAPCPMMEAESSSAAHSEMQGDASHDCCNDAETFSKTGKLCKTDLPCQSVNQMPLSVYSLLFFAMTVEPPRPMPERVIRFHEPARIWRPPALI